MRFAYQGEPGAFSEAAATRLDPSAETMPCRAFEDVFARQLEPLGSPGDVLVAITTSGGSPNVVKAVAVAHALGMIVIGMTGRRGARFADLCDHALVTPSDVTPRIQEGHIAMGHTVCELVEKALFGAAVRRDAAAARARARRRPASAKAGRDGKPARRRKAAR